MDITAADGKGKDAKAYTVHKDLGETLEQSVEMFGDTVVHKNFVSNVVVSVQNIVRTAIRAGKTLEEVQKMVDDYAPGIRQRGKSREEKIKEELRSMTAAERKALLAEVAKEAAQAA